MNNQDNLINLICIAVAVIMAGALYFLDTTGLALLLMTILGIILFNAVIKKPALGVLSIIATLPFERLLTTSVGGMTVKPVHFVIAVVGLAWLTLFLLDRARLTVPNAVWLALLFWLVGIWSYAISVDPTRTFKVAMFWLVALLGFWLTIQLTDKPLVLRRANIAVVVVASIVALFGLFQVFGDVIGLPFEITGIKPGYDKSTFGFPRVHSTLAEPLYYGNFLLVPFFLVVCYFLYGGAKHLTRNRSLAISLLLLSSIILTFSRGAYAGLGVGALLLMAWQYKKFFARDNIVIIASVLTLAFVMALTFFATSDSKARDEIFDHLSMSRLNAESVVSRKDASALALEWWRVFPWRGVGLGGYGKLELEDKFQSQTDDYQPIVNNQYLETLVEMGVIGLVLFILFFGFVLVRSVQAWFVVDNNFDRATLAGLTIGIIAILAQYATFSTIYIVYVWVFTGLLIANQEKILSKNNKKDERLNSK